MSVTMRVSGPADLLPLVPHVLGFTPRQSGVIMSVNARGRVGVTARYDLPEDPQEALAAAAQLLPVLVRESAAGVLVVGYEDVAGESRLFGDAFSRVLGLAGIAVLDSLAVQGGRWVRPSEPGVGGAMPQAAAVEAELVGMGSAPLPDRASLEACFRPGAAAEAVGTVCDGRGAPHDVPSLQEAVQACTAVLDPDAAPVGELTSEVLAVAAVGLRSVDLRDSLMALLVPDLQPPTETPALVLLRQSLPPLAGREREVTERVRTFSTHLPDRHVAPVATLLAAMCWSQGDGARTLIALDRARVAEPDYRLAALLAELVSSGIRFPAASVPA